MAVINKKNDISKIIKNPLHLEIYPGSQMLREVADSVDVFDSDILLLASEMFDFMRKHGGIGLAAPQIGLLRRIIVIGFGNQSFCVVNPKITLAFDCDWMKEGCLSLPGKIVNIKRHKNIEVQGFDISGKSVTISASGLLARVFQHEIEHLNGIMICDYDNLL
ncbi:MAG: peptide deformylase [Sedimentisphaerales bacterium]|nr:peptide deformylase [Sedimentisphaerales bacterium]